jgi:hypothetical protein
MNLSGKDCVSAQLHYYIFDVVFRELKLLMVHYREPYRHAPTWHLLSDK